jgi:hypothetical protein
MCLKFESLFQKPTLWNKPWQSPPQLKWHQNCSGKHLENISGVIAGCLMSMSADPRKEKGSHAYSLISIMPTAGFGSSNISEPKNITSSGSLEKNQN